MVFDRMYGAVRGQPQGESAAAGKQIGDPSLAALVSALVVSDEFLALFPTGDSRAYPFALQSFSEPIGIMSAISEKPIYFGQAAL